jgi:diacylglycerol kinase family enzyme
MKHYILYNPLAGNKSGEAHISELTEMLHGESILVDVTKLNNYTEVLSLLCKGDDVVILGGDGTLNRFVNDLDGRLPDCPILYYAVGTGNDFLRDVEGEDGSRPFEVNKYLKNLPVATINGKDYRFLNGVGFGIDGYCCEVGDKLRESDGEKPINYTAIAIKGLLFHFKPVTATVTVDGVEYTYKKVWIAPTMNGKFYGGGMMPTPEQDRLSEDGKVSLMLFHGTGKIKTLMIFPSLFKGEHVKHKDAIAIHEGHSITVKFDRPCALQIDGETYLGVTEYSVTAKAREHVAS